MSKSVIPYEITSISHAEYPEVMQVWEASVRATHHFVKEEDVLYFKELVPHYLDVVRLFAVRNSKNGILGFLGVSEDNIEMLFIHPDSRGKKIGTTLMKFAVGELHLRKVDVNEENEQAVAFYLFMGFSVVGRSELDRNEKPYPILHMVYSG